MVQIENIQQLLDLYVNKIHSTIQIFQTIFGSENPTKLWRQGLISRTGYLDNLTEYSFHGAGCTIEFENGETISFDFLEDDTITFDLFKFENFVLEKIEDQESVLIFFKRIKLCKDGETWKITES